MKPRVGRRLALMVLSAVLGAGAGEGWIRFDRRQRGRDDGPVGPTRRPPEHDHASHREVRPPQRVGGEPPDSTLAARDASDPTGAASWPDGFDPLRGASGAAILHSSDANLPRPEGAPELADAVWRELARAERALTQESLARLQRLGRPPWDGARFQIVSSLDTRLLQAVIGRGFEIPASPETSLRWYAGDRLQSLSADASQRAGTALHEYEAERRALVVRVVDRLWQLTSGADGERVVAYALVDGRLVVIRDGEIAGLPPLLDRGAALLPNGIDAARALARRSR